MGLTKAKMIEIEGRGYGETDKCVCSGCIGDQFLVKIIRRRGETGACSFCKDDSGKPIKHRKVYRLEELMKDIMPAIRYYYMDADGNIPYDTETKAYMGYTIDHYDFVHGVLAEEMQMDNPDLLEELYDVIEQKTRTTIYEFVDSASRKNLRAWAKYTDLVTKRSELSVEQMVSLCVHREAPDDLKEIHAVLQEVLSQARALYSYSVINTGTPIYRCVNFHLAGHVVKGYKTIPATLIGTAPAKFAESGRFNEKGDMMFYGASTPGVVMKEVGEKAGYPFTIGEFHTNKRIRILNLCSVESWKRPSIFSLEQMDMERRESWLFLKEYIDRISIPVDRKNADEYYKPIQVFTKYVQRVSGLYGIEYRSSKSDRDKRYGEYIQDRCYVLFVESKDCLDESERKYKLNTNRLQLFMKRQWQESLPLSTGDA